MCKTLLLSVFVPALSRQTFLPFNNLIVIFLLLYIQQNLCQFFLIISCFSIILSDFYVTFWRMCAIILCDTYLYGTLLGGTLLCSTPLSDTLFVLQFVVTLLYDILDATFSVQQMCTHNTTYN